jgi:hypothetical protein
MGWLCSIKQHSHAYVIPGSSRRVMSVDGLRIWLKLFLSTKPFQLVGARSPPYFSLTQSTHVPSGIRTTLPPFSGVFLLEKRSFVFWC